MPGRGITDAIFAARQVMEKQRELQKELHMVFIDQEKAYDRVSRQEVWRCLREQGVPEKCVRLAEDTYEDARTQVKIRDPFTGRDSKDNESTDSHTWDRRWRRMENWMRKSHTGCRAGGRTGRKCLECCATGKWTWRSTGRHRGLVRPALIYGAEKWTNKRDKEIGGKT